MIMENSKDNRRIEGWIKIKESNNSQQRRRMHATLDLMTSQEGLEGA
jgi:hypothetical protein